MSTLTRFKLFRGVIEALLLTAFACCPGVFATSPEPLPNFHQVHPYLYRGGEPSPEGLAKLKQMGIKTIIDLRGHPGQTRAEAGQARDSGMEYINLPMDYHAPTEAQQQKLFKALSGAESSHKNGNPAPVFVHCAHGSDRTGCMIGLWRVRHDGWSYEDAYKEMRKYYFTPKFTLLSGAVKQAAGAKLKVSN